MGIVSKEYLTKLAAVSRGEKIEGPCAKSGCKEKGQERADHGLLCGCWCDKHFDEMVHACRSRSW